MSQDWKSSLSNRCAPPKDGTYFRTGKTWWCTPVPKMAQRNLCSLPQMIWCWVLYQGGQSRSISRSRPALWSRLIIGYSGVFKKNKQTKTETARNNEPLLSPQHLAGRGIWIALLVASLAYIGSPQAANLSNQTIPGIK